MSLSPRLQRLARLAGASPAALALALSAVPAMAQSFDATGNVVSGLANITTGANLTEVTIDSPEVVINWFPNDVSNSGPILFQPGGTTAIFDTFLSSNVNDYTVLNRIFPRDAVGAPINQPVRFEGTVESRVQGVAGRGSLWFYSPTGIIVGNGAAFNVGSLLLTTADIDTAGGLYGPGGVIRMAGPAAPASFVQVNATANLVGGAGGGPSYIAMVAPRVVQSGTINAGGQVALVAAEAADITIGTGLLDIVVSQGSADANGIVHSGTTTGAASTGLADVQQIQFVAIPKNTAMTMLLSGSIGYAPAASALDDGSAIILSAGVAPYVPQATQDLGLGNISVGNAEFRNAVTGDATNTIDILPTGGLVDFQANATLTAGLAINAIAEDGEAIQGAANIVLRARRAGAGGTITLRALGGALPGVIAAAGSLVADGNGFHGATPPVTGPNSLGGAIIVEADGGEISATDMTFSASGFGGEGLDSGGNGTGGSVTATISNGGTLTAGLLSLEADGGGGNGNGIAGGTGTGGAVSLRVVDGTLLTSIASLTARGFGGQSAAQNGSALGGTALMEVLSGNQVMDGLFTDSGAFAGEPFIAGSIAGNAQGAADGAVLHVGNGASLTVNDNLVLRATGVGAIDPRPTGFAQGGEARVLVDGGATLTTGGQFEVDARAEISDESYSPDLLRSPRLQGGTASVIADGGTIDAQGLVVRAPAIGAGAQSQAGTATGGPAEVVARNGATIDVANGLADIDLLIDAEGQGGLGPSPGAAQGGTARLIANDATINVGGTARVSASARDGIYANAIAGPGYAAIGGSARVEIEAGTAGTGQMNLADIFIRADGDASGPTGGIDPIPGNGGAGAGGSATLAIRAGQFNAAQVTVQALGLGGNSAASLVATPFQSGSGTGGSALLVQSGGTSTTGAISLLAFGQGGSGPGSALGAQTPSLGGNGLGGSAEARLAGGSLTVPSLLVDGSGRGGSGMAADSASAAPGGNGGNGTGGSALLAFPAGSTALLNVGTVAVVARGLGQCRQWHRRLCPVRCRRRRLCPGRDADRCRWSGRQWRSRRQRQRRHGRFPPGRWRNRRRLHPHRGEPCPARARPWRHQRLRSSPGHHGRSHRPDGAGRLGHGGAGHRRRFLGPGHRRHGPGGPGLCRQPFRPAADHNRQQPDPDQPRCLDRGRGGIGAGDQRHAHHPDAAHGDVGRPCHRGQQCRGSGRPRPVDDRPALRRHHPAARGQRHGSCHHGPALHRPCHRARPRGRHPWHPGPVLCRCRCHGRHPAPPHRRQP
jgi:hypothetical protein